MTRVYCDKMTEAAGPRGFHCEVAQCLNILHDQFGDDIRRESP